jgi:hypothetical protein
MVVAPTTGAVVVNTTESPSFTGNTTIGTAGAYSDNGSGNGTLYIGTGSPASLTSLGTYGSSGTLNSIFPDVLGITDNLVAPPGLFAFDRSGNFSVAGGVFSTPLASSAGDCLTSDANGQIISTGAACGGGGGGVSSVTAGPSGNLTFAPTTGAVVGDIIENPTFTGAIHDTLTSGSSSIVTVSQFPIQWTTGSGNGEQQKNDNSTTVASVLNTDWGIWDFTTSAFQAAIDDSGNLGIAGSLFSAPLASFVGQGVAIGTNGQLVPSGATSVQIKHGNQSITAVAAACTPGTPITFATPFTAVPDITGSTDPVVGDTFAPSAVTTTGFTPEVCSVASAATVTVYWSAQN